MGARREVVSAVAEAFRPRMPSRAFTVALGLIALITPLAVHLFLPVIPAVKVALGLSDARAQCTSSKPSPKSFLRQHVLEAPHWP